MSKFFVTNKKSLFEDIKRRVEESPFEICFSREGEIYGLTTQKLTVSNVNGKAVGNGFVTVTGTMVWGEGEKVDDGVLCTIWESYKGNPDTIRKSCIGNYAVTIINSGKGVVFSDLSGFYNVYYYNSNNIWLISNSLYDMYAVLKNSLSLDKLSLIEFVLHNSILNGDTQFNEIKRLRGFDYLRFDANKLDCIVEKHPYPLADGSFIDNVNNYVSFSKDYALKTYQAFGKPTIAMTGGLDARMLLASYLANGVKPDLYYGTGDSLITNTKDQDKQIDRLYSELFDLTLLEESWKTPDPMDKYWDKYLEIFGFSYDIYASSDAVMESVLNNSNSFFVFGEGGEMLRNQLWIDERESDSFTLEEFLNEYYVPQDIKDSIVDIDSHMRRMRMKFKDICNYYQLDLEHILSEDMFLLTLERRKTADSETVNWMNLIRYDCVQMIQYEGLLSARLKYKDTSNAKFMLYCQNGMFPKILDVPIFSHCKMRKFDRESMTISESISFLQRVKATLRNSFPSLYRATKKKLHKDQVHSSSYNSLVYDRALHLYNKINISNLFNIDNFTDQRSLIKYLMFINAINKISKNN